ncbi:TPA: ankyrin repeat domain-containing protein, partial [Legionella anisa]
VRGKFDEFQKRMEFIHSYEDDTSFSKDVTLAESVRLKKHEISKTFWKWEWNTLNADEKQLEASKADLLCSIRPFFDGIESYMQGYLYPELFEVNHAPKKQDALISSQLVAENSKEMEPFDKIMVAHNKTTLTEYLDKLCALKNNSIEGLAIGLNAYEHGMALVRNKGQWALVNHDEIIQFANNEACAQAIIERFSTNSNAVFSMTFHPGLLTKTKEIKELNQTEENKQLEMNKLTDSKGVNLLSLATSREDLNRVTYLLDNGADVNGDGESPLFIAARLGNYALAEMFLKKKADPDIANKKSETPLLEAVRTGYSQMVELLLRYDADPNKSNKDDESPLFIAVSNGNHSLAETLLKKGALVELKNQVNTPILKAIENADAKMVKLLVEYEVDINESSSIFNTTPLEKAVENKNFEMVLLLMSLGADPYIKNISSDDGEMNALELLFSNYKMNNMIIIEDRILYEFMPEDETERRDILNQIAERFSEMNQDMQFANKEDFVNYFMKRISMAEEFETKLKSKVVDEVLKDLDDLDLDISLVEPSPNQHGVQSKSRAPESDKINCQTLRQTLTSFRESQNIDKSGDEDIDKSSDDDGEGVHLS